MGWDGGDFENIKMSCVEPLSQVIDDTFIVTSLYRVSNLGRVTGLS